MGLKAGDIMTTGVVTEINRNDIRVKLTEVSAEPIIRASVCGKMKRSNIRISVGDKVKIIIPQASPELGIIKFRERNPNQPAFVRKK